MIGGCDSASVSASGSLSGHTSTAALRGAAHAEDPAREVTRRLGSAHADGSLSAGARRHEADAGDAAEAA